MSHDIFIINRNGMCHPSSGLVFKHKIKSQVWEEGVSDAISNKIMLVFPLSLEL
jgi:hypothetical protein